MVSFSFKAGNKKFVNPNISKKTTFGSFYSNLANVSDKLNIAYHRPNCKEIVTLKNGNLYSVFKIDGISFETEDDNRLNYFSKLIHNCFRAIFSENLTIHSHILRRKGTIDSGLNLSDNKFCNFLDQRYYKKLNDKEFFINDLYMAFEYRPKHEKLGLLGSLTKDKESFIASIAQAEEEFLEILLQVKSFFGTSSGEEKEERTSSFGAKQLSVRHQGGIEFSEVAEFEALLLHNARVDVPISSFQPLFNCVAINTQINFVKDAFEIDYLGHDKVTGIVLGIKDIPQTVQGSSFDNMLKLPFEFSISQSFNYDNSFKAMDTIKRRLRKMNQANDAGVVEAQILTEALEAIQNRENYLGKYNCNVLVFGVNTDKAKKNASLASATLAESGFIMTREVFGACEGGFWSRFGGNSDFWPRPIYLSSSAFSVLSSFHNFRSGSKKNHWGDPITILKGSGSNLFRFSWHINDLGNSLVLGPSGSGKTVVLTFMIAQSLKQNIRTVFFDKDNGAEILIRALGGDYSTLVKGKPSGLAPLKAFGDYNEKISLILEEIEAFGDNITDEDVLNIVTPFTRDIDLSKEFLEFREKDNFEEFINYWNRQDGIFLSEFIICLIGDNVRNGLLSATDRMSIQSAVFQVLNLTKKTRNFASLISLVGDKEIRNALSEWADGGNLGWLFDNDEDSFSNLLNDATSLLGFDITTILDNKLAISAFTFYAFNRIEELMTGKPIQIFFDEFWKSLKSEEVVKFIENKLKVIRKQNGAFIGGTQSADDILGSEISSTIIDQCKTQLLFPNQAARFEDYEKLGCSHKEFSLISSDLIGTRKFLIKKEDYSVVAELDLYGEHQILKVCSGRAETVEEMNTLIANTSRNPDDWLPKFIDMEFEK